MSANEGAHAQGEGERAPRRVIGEGDSQEPEEDVGVSPPVSQNQLEHVESAYRLGTGGGVVLLCPPEMWAADPHASGLLHSSAACISRHEVVRIRWADPHRLHELSGVGGWAYGRRHGCTGAGKNAVAALSKRPHAHPYTIPPFPAAQEVWFIRQGAAEPLGFVLKHPDLGGYVFDVYAHCRDAGGRRPWLRTSFGFNAAGAWTVQREPEIRALIAQKHRGELAAVGVRETDAAVAWRLRIAFMGLRQCLASEAPWSGQNEPGAKSARSAKGVSFPKRWVTNYGQDG